VNEHRHTHWLVTISLESLQFVELEGALQVLAAETICLEMVRMASDPLETVLHCSPGDA
jgi:hypothetical protein